MYVYLKSLQQPTYLENLFIPIDQNGYFMFSNNSDVSLNKAREQILFLSLVTWHATSRMQ